MSREYQTSAYIVTHTGLEVPVDIYVDEEGAVLHLGNQRVDLEGSLLDWAAQQRLEYLNDYEDYTDDFLEDQIERRAER